MSQVDVNLSGVPETLLIPLRARYLETKKESGIIHDPKSVEICDRINNDSFRKREVSPGSCLGVALRTEILDDLVKGFLGEHPGATVVNLGCGLDTRYHRLDNGSLRWYDLDMPQVIELRKNFFQETERFSFISSSVMDFTWMDKVAEKRPVLFIAEGLFMYFTREEVASLFREISRKFPGGEMILEAMSPFMAARTGRHRDVKHFNSQFQWGIESGDEINLWNTGARYINEYYYFDRHKKKQPWYFRLLSLFPGFRKMMKVIHVRFDMSL